MLTILFDGVAYGMLLFILACGLSVTLGLMNFVNLAHGSFAMAGGYITVIVVNRYGVPFYGGLVLAFVFTALGDKQKALEWLATAVRQHTASNMKVDPYLDPLRAEPEFQRLLAQARLN